MTRTDILRTIALISVFLLNRLTNYIFCKYNNGEGGKAIGMDDSWRKKAGVQARETARS